MSEPIRCPAKGAFEIEHDGKQFGVFCATVPAEHTLDDVLAPEYFGKWQARSKADRMLRVGDMIDIRPLDCSWYVRLMVRACLPTVDKVITATIVDPKVFDTPELPDGWTMKYTGIQRKWMVFFEGSSKAADLTTPEEAYARVMELAGDAPVKNKGGRPRKVQTEPAKEPETV